MAIVVVVAMVAGSGVGSGDVDIVDFSTGNVDGGDVDNGGDSSDGNGKQWWPS